MAKVECTCQQCEKVFKSHPSKIHKYCSIECRNKAYGSGKFSRQCSKCGNIFETRQSHSNRRYCSRECYDIAIKELVIVKATCKQCGCLFELKRKGSKTLFCSHECRVAARRTKVSANCLVCGKYFIVPPSEIRRGRGKYCSKKCSGIASQGEQSPHWKGGGVLYYGFKWYHQRDKAYARDNGKCQHCGLTEKQAMKKYCRENAVHHIKKARYFNGDYEAANDLSNLITLCPQCHPKAEHGKIAVPVRLL